MGAARLRKSKRRQLLEAHPLCIYCGAPATTTDHCPPRCFFEDRIWPESYEFPACEACHASARYDEQALAVVVRAKALSPQSPEWEELVKGAKNNQPEIVAEWMSMSRNEQKFALRDTFGRDTGDDLRRHGWITLNLGPLTKAMIDRFMIKLAQALYFRHLKAPLDGFVYVSHINAVNKDVTPELISSILSNAAVLPTIKRSKTSLLDQFIYRFSCSAEHGVMYAVVLFGEQFIFQLIALSKAFASGLAAQAERNGMELPTVNRFECFLERREIDLTHGACVAAGSGSMRPASGAVVVTGVSRAAGNSVSSSRSMESSPFNSERTGRRRSRPAWSRRGC